MIKYLILLVIFSSCLSKTKKAKKIEPVSIQYDFNIDSLKWCFYTLNYQGNAFFYDSANKKKLIFKPTECSVVLDVYNKKNKDTSYYFFKFNKKNFHFLYVDLSGGQGLANYKNNIVPVQIHGIYDFLNYSDSTKLYLDRSNNKFCTYLKDNNSQIDDWLLNEAIRKKVISKLR